MKVGTNRKLTAVLMSHNISRKL